MRASIHEATLADTGQWPHWLSLTFNLSPEPEPKPKTVRELDGRAAWTIAVVWLPKTNYLFGGRAKIYLALDKLSG